MEGGKKNFVVGTSKGLTRTNRSYQQPSCLKVSSSGVVSEAREGHSWRSLRLLRGGGPQRSLYGPWVKGPLVGPVHEEVRVVTESSALKFFHDLVGPSFETVRADHVPDEEGPSSVMRRRLLRRAGLHQELQ